MAGFEVLFIVHHYEVTLIQSLESCRGEDEEILVKNGVF
jgi:hypothetical protein